MPSPLDKQHAGHLDAALIYFLVALTFVLYLRTQTLLSQDATSASAVLGESLTRSILGTTSAQMSEFRPTPAL
ncbi:hypothetical protein FPV67DRAFT_1670764 [Lyophyllum atratum]|nr:hypothetical protein FPV67DRAFT_1670764 [Lyophyllum atratum]